MANESWFCNQVAVPDSATLPADIDLRNHMQAARRPERNDSRRSIFLAEGGRHSAVAETFIERQDDATRTALILHLADEAASFETAFRHVA